MGLREQSNGPARQSHHAAMTAMVLITPAAVWPCPAPAVSPPKLSSTHLGRCPPPRREENTAAVTDCFGLGLVVNRLLASSFHRLARRSASVGSFEVWGLRVNRCKGFRVQGVKGRGVEGLQKFRRFQDADLRGFSNAGTLSGDGLACVAAGGLAVGYQDKQLPAVLSSGSCVGRAAAE